jgi:hypothetical protein
VSQVADVMRVMAFPDYRHETAAEGLLKGIARYWPTLNDTSLPIAAHMTPAGRPDPREALGEKDNGK